MRRYSSRVGVDERIVRDVNRIQSIVQEAAQSLGRAQAHRPARRQKVDNGEDDKDAERIMHY